MTLEEAKQQRATIESFLSFCDNEGVYIVPTQWEPWNDNGPEDDGRFVELDRIIQGDNDEELIVKFLAWKGGAV